MHRKNSVRLLMYYSGSSVATHLSSFAHNSRRGRNIFFIHRLLEINSENSRVSKFSFKIRALKRQTNSINILR
jgi:hypothetical protein